LLNFYRTLPRKNFQISLQFHSFKSQTLDLAFHSQAPKNAFETFVYLPILFILLSWEFPPASCSALFHSNLAKAGRVQRTVGAVHGGYSRPFFGWECPIVCLPFVFSSLPRSRNIKSGFWFAAGEALLVGVYWVWAVDVSCF
jgi:hypothetical protein